MLVARGPLFVWVAGAWTHSVLYIEIVINMKINNRPNLMGLKQALLGFEPRISCLLDRRFAI